MNVALRLRQGGPFMWTVVTVGIHAWLVHIVLLASLVDLMCEHPSVEWVMHAVTVVTGLVTAAGAGYCVRMARATDDEAAGTVEGRTSFLGRFGLLVNAISLALIVLEGAYVPFIDPCA